MQFCGVVGPCYGDSRTTFARVLDPVVETSSSELQERLKGAGFDVRTNLGVEDGTVVIARNGDRFVHRYELTKGKQPKLSQSFYRASGSRTSMRPSLYQRELAVLLDRSDRETKKRFLVYWTMGSGKTYGVLNALKDCTELVVVCPVTLICTAWLDAMRSIASDENHPVQVMHAMGPDAAKKILKGHPRYFAGKTVVMDEIQLLRNSSFTGMAALMSSMDRAEFVTGLSGTPLVNSSDEVDYLFRFFSGRAEEGEERASALRRVAEGRVHHYDDKSKLPTVETETVTIRMTPYQTMIYALGIRQHVNIGPLIVQTRPKQVAFKTFESQVCTRVERKDPKTGEVQEQCPKMDECAARIASLASSGCSRQAVYCHFIENLAEPLIKKLRSCDTGYDVVIVQGKTPTAERASIIERYNKPTGDRPLVLVFTDAANLGMSLKMTGHMHVLDVAANASTRDQVIFRAARKGSHPPGSVLKVTQYVSCFPPKNEIKEWRRDNTGKDLIRDFRIKYRLGEEISQCDLVAAMEKILEEKGFQTVEEQRTRDITQKEEQLNPYLQSLKNAAVRPVLMEPESGARGTRSAEATDRLIERLLIRLRPETFDTEGTNAEKRIAAIEEVKKFIFHGLNDVTNP